MYSSRVYREIPQADLRRVQFLEFSEGSDDLDGGLCLEAREFVEEELSAVVEPLSLSVRQEAAASVEKPDVDALVSEACARGRREALSQASQEFGLASDALGRALEELSLLRESLLKNSAEDMKRLVMTIAEQVVGNVVACDSELILRTIKKALHFAVQSDEYHIRVNPADFRIVTEKKPLFLSSVAGLNNIIFESDPGIEPGGCIVESELGEVDATIGAQLEEIRKSLSASDPSL